MKLKVGLRPSPLSFAQLEELKEEIEHRGISCELIPIPLVTLGDLDKKTSLQKDAPPDFFTQKIDEAILSGEIDCALHSFKDLSFPLISDLLLIAITKGKSPSDSLVFKEGKQKEDFYPPCRIGTSSLRRSADIKTLFPLAECIDIRGTIEERLQLLETKNLDGVILAEAALERLNLLHLPRLKLPFTTALGQGRLAIIIHKKNQEILSFLEKLHVPLPDFSESLCLSI